MKKLSYQRIYESEEYLSPLGRIRHRALFGGYSLSVDDTVFAMVAQGDLYLKLCERSATYLVAHPPQLLRLSKRGRAVELNYYLVDETLWQDRPLLLSLSAQSLQEAQAEKLKHQQAGRLKSLPNISFQLEMLMHEAGVRDVRTLKALGAPTVWYRLHCLRRDLNPSVVLALEGAIHGVHAAALPPARRQHLLAWAEMLTGKGGGYPR